MKLQLKYETILCGEFKKGKANLLLVFQVNCPGCFLYAFPIANQVFEHYNQKGLNVFGLSTAFEDFHLNNLANTRLVLEQGELVGETKEAFRQHGYEKFPFQIPFPIAFDVLSKTSDVDIEKETGKFCQNLEGFSGKPSEEKDFIAQSIRKYFSEKSYSAFTFDSNHLQGTPSWILFDREDNVHYKGFGHKDYELLERKVIDLLNR